MGQRCRILARLRGGDQVLLALRRRKRLGGILWDRDLTEREAGRSAQVRTWSWRFIFIIGAPTTDS